MSYQFDFADVTGLEHDQERLIQHMLSDARADDLSRAVSTGIADLESGCILEQFDRRQNVRNLATAILHVLGVGGGPAKYALYKDEDGGGISTRCSRESTLLALAVASGSCTALKAFVKEHNRSSGECARNVAAWMSTVSAYSDAHHNKTILHSVQNAVAIVYHDLSVGLASDALKPPPPARPVNDAATVMALLTSGATTSSDTVSKYTYTDMVDWVTFAAPPDRLHHALFRHDVVHMPYFSADMRTSFFKHLLPDSRLHNTDLLASLRGLAATASLAHVDDHMFLIAAVQFCHNGSIRWPALCAELLATWFAALRSLSPAGSTVIVAADICMPTIEDARVTAGLLKHTSLSMFNATGGGLVESGRIVDAMIVSNDLGLDASPQKWAGRTTSNMVWVVDSDCSWQISAAVRARSSVRLRLSRPPTCLRSAFPAIATILGCAAMISSVAYVVFRQFAGHD